MPEQNTSGSELYQQLVHPPTTEYKGTGNNITTSIDNMHHITKGQPPNTAIYQKQKGNIKRGGISNQKTRAEWANQPAKQGRSTTYHNRQLFTPIIHTSNSEHPNKRLVTTKTTPKQKVTEPQKPSIQAHDIYSPHIPTTKKHLTREESVLGFIYQ
jgi:hypothetical protein